MSFSAAKFLIMKCEVTAMKRYTRKKNAIIFNKKKNYARARLKQICKLNI